MARPKVIKPVVTDDFSKTSAMPSVTEETVNIDGENVPVSEIVIESAAIVPESEVTEEMKQEIPLNTPETAIPMVDNAFDSRVIASADHFNEKFFEAQAKSGCDYKSFGDWQKAYAGLMVRAFSLSGKRVLDVGSAYGAIGYAMKQLGANVTCLDISEHVTETRLFDVEYKRAPVQEMSVVDLRQDFIHASYVMNCVEEADLEAVFVEFKRLLLDGGKVFIIMNFGKGQKVADFDIRHSKESIVAAAEKAGLKEVKGVQTSLRNVDDARYEFMSHYNWGIVCFE